MAQIIKHRRGSLESISSATKRAGELLVVTGSAGITATNGNSILFVGIDGSTATPANKILQGSENPNLTGASYDTSIDGIPFYNTSTEKLYILNKGGNVEVKATANTGGSGIVSGSSQVTDLLPVGTVSGSSQVVGILGALNTFSASQESKDSTLATYTASVDSALTNLINITGSYATTGSNTFVSNQTISGSILVTDVIQGTGSIFLQPNNTDSRKLEIYNTEPTDVHIKSTGGLTFLGDDINYVKVDDSAQTITITGSNGVYISGIDSTIGVFSQSVDFRLEEIESSIGGASGIGLRVSSLEAFTGSQETKNSTLGTYTASLETKNSTLATYTGSVNDKFSTLGTYTGSVSNSLTTLNVFSASEETKNNTLGVYTASVEVSLSALNTFTQSQDNLNDTLATTGSNVFFGTQTITGSLFITNNLVVQGSSSLQNITASAVNIGTNQINLNTDFPAFRYAGLNVYDSGSSGVSASLQWDSLTDQWIFVHKESGSATVDSSILLYGPLSTAGLGSETGLTSNYLTKVEDNGHGHHLTTSSIEDTGTKVTVYNSLEVTGGITGSIAATNGVVSGSSQITISSTTGYSDFSSSIAASVSASVAGATWENLNGKPSGIVSGSSQVVDYLVSQNVSLAGISGSSLDITGNAKIDGNVIIGGNITIGDSTTDTVSFAADLTSDIIPSGSNVRSLGSASRLFANVYATNLYGAVNATNGVISGSSQVDADSITNFDTNVKDKLNVDGVISGSSQVNADSITNFDSNVLAYNNSLGVVSGSSQINADSITNFDSNVLAYNNSLGVISGSSQLNGTTINNLTTTATGSFTGSFKGDGSNLTGIASTLAFSGSTGNDTLNLKTEALLVTGSNSISAAVSDNTITITAANASTSAKGVASFDADDFSVTTGNVSIKENGVRAVNLNADVAGTGLSLNGGNNSIEVDYGSTSGTAVAGNTSLTVSGTANEIEISGGSITLGNGGTVTIGLPDSVTIATASIQNDLSVGRHLTVEGNLYVNGTTTTIDSTTIQIGDNIIELNGFGGANAGLVVRDVNTPNMVSGSLLWDSTNDFWMGGALSNEKEFARFNATPTSGSVQVIGANGLLVNSQISDDAIKVTIGTDLVISGLSASSFLVSNGSKKLISVTPSNAGDMVQWNGSSFIASNEIDGGTF